MTQQEKPLVGHTRQTELTIDQIAEMQPGLAMLMPQIGDRYWIMYYAAKGGNWPLARHQLNEIRGLMRQGALTRPRYANQLNAYMNDYMAVILKAITSEDFPAFEAAFHKGTEEANRLHVETNHGEITWQLPADPPKQLSLKPPAPKANP